jgi:2-amino-4-hydroxy-6-hydroxymethyldihydropteridine diphosphokinase
MTSSLANSPAVSILIGLGSNLAPERHVPFALRELRALFAEVRVSTIHWTSPLGGLDQPRYANGVVAARTGLLPCQVKKLLRGIEDRAGRERLPGRSYASRTLDLDLLAYGDGAVPELGLPDGDLLERDFVLLPAAELCPDWRHPILGRTLAELAAERFPVPPNIMGPVDFPLGG